MAETSETLKKELENQRVEEEGNKKNLQQASKNIMKYSTPLLFSKGLPHTTEVDILKIFKLENKIVVFAWAKEGQVRVFLEQENKKMLIPSYDVDGIPKECFTDPNKMKAFLSESYVRVSEFLSRKEFKISVNLKLLGGGNIGIGITKWSVMPQEDGTLGIVIPYIIYGSQEAVPVLNGEKKLFQLHLSKSKLEKVSKEIEVHKAISTAIQKWNNTGVVDLLSREEYQEKYGKKPTHWIRFSTVEPDICQAPCIGMCPTPGEQVVSCDLSEKFYEHPVQSIMHEIGHVIGLRHEHARSDRDCYVDTNFVVEEQTCLPVGQYDFNSVMHYELGNYDDRRFLTRNIKPLAPAPSGPRTSKVGTDPTISDGDIAAIKELYKDEFAEARHQARVRGFGL